MTTEIKDERTYLSNRLRDINFNKRRDLEREFHINEYLGPKTYAELIDWIKSDKFTLDKKRTARIDMYVEDDEWYSNAFDGIIWKGRFEIDHDKYREALRSLDTANQNARDIIMTSDAAAGLKALKKFEEWTH